MEHLIKKYLNKLESQRLARGEDALFLAVDADLFSNRPLEGDMLKLSRIFDLMNISSVLFAEPSEPYRSIIREVIKGHGSWTTGREATSPLASCPLTHASSLKRIVPMDCETRTFFHDIPVVDDFSPEAIAQALSRRKAAIVKDRGIVTYGALTPEQAFVSFSSTCFSTFVKYFYDSLVCLEGCSARGEPPDKDFMETFKKIGRDTAEILPDTSRVTLMAGPPRDGDNVVRMLSEAGRAVVQHHLVDSYFGNISYVYDDRIFISETGSSLDELDACIDAVPLDGSSSVGITASSELSAHKKIYEETGHRAILHGHPKFSVILSMHCSEEGCDRSDCYRSCRKRRYTAGVPIVSGEIGTGPTGLLHTVPPAMKEGRGAIVYGHGVFTSGVSDFQGPFARLSEIEIACREEYFRKVREYL